MSLPADTVEGRGLQFGASPLGVTSLAPEAFKSSGADHSMPIVPVTDAVLPPFHETDAKDEKASIDSQTPSIAPFESQGVQYVNGEPVITTGEDVSNFVVDDRDDGDEALTFRSFVLGTIIAGLGAALSQVRSAEFLGSS